MSPMPQSFGGMKVFVSPDSPKMKLSEDVPVSPEFRAEINAWMVRFFGTTNVVEDGQTIVSQALGFITMNPRTYANFRAALPGQGESR